MKYPKLPFSCNWNNKLNSEAKAFTTFRIQNTKYRVGAKFEIFLKDQPLGIATVVSSSDMTLRSLHEAIAQIDNGYSLEEFRGIVRKMYNNADRELFSFIVLQWDKRWDNPPV